MTYFFPSFVEEEDNKKLMDPITKEELQSICTGFERTKSLTLMAGESNSLWDSMNYRRVFVEGC